MAKYTYTDNNGIVFTNLDSSPNPKLSVPGKLVSNQNDFEYADEDGIKPLVNAVEIDWNGAKPGIGEGTSGIKTGEIIKGTLRGS